MNQVGFEFNGTYLKKKTISEVDLFDFTSFFGLDINSVKSNIHFLLLLLVTGNGWK